MNTTLTELAWPAARLGEAMETLARRTGLAVPRGDAAAPPHSLAGTGGELIDDWIEALAARLGLEAESVEAPHAEVRRLMTGAAPALLRLPGESEPRFLVLITGNRRHVVLLSPELTAVPVRPDLIGELLCQPWEASVCGSVDRILANIRLSAKRRRRAQAALLGELLAQVHVGGCWLLRVAGTAGLTHHAREASLPRLLTVVVAAHACEYVLWLASWWLLGWISFQGRLEPGWFLAWLLLLLTLVPFRLLATSAGGRFAIRAGAVLKRRLLFGALQLESEEVRHLGVGQLLGRVIESEAVESMAIEGGFLALTASVELVLAAFVLAAGAGGWLHALLLAGALLGAAFLGLRYWRSKGRWTKDRLAMTNDLVERMIGHRTRLGQQPRQEWNEGEDQALERYLGVSRQLDQSATVMEVLVPRGWFLLGLLGLAPAFLSGGSSTTALAIGVGGVVLAYQALGNLVIGFQRLSSAAIAWQQIKLFWKAAARREPVGHPGVAASVPLALHRRPDSARDPVALQGDKPLLSARDLVYRHRGRGRPVLEQVSLSIAAGERLLLEGPSGGGKSTLATLLAGCRVPETGLLLLRGFDRETLGAEAWRQRVVIAPQFHENHVLMGSFAFNVLMGRAWPPCPADLEEAVQVCRALQLGPLLDRMPAGILQVVGETGWQLSHGEKSRLYIARALLQRADLIVLDESFAALDPQTLERTLSYVLQRAPTVLVIAHP
ncbi:MAG: ATP-binding cassette domain-containing protein [Thermoguttaceae bacterium]